MPYNIIHRCMIAVRWLHLKKVCGCCFSALNICEQMRLFRCSLRRRTPNEIIEFQKLSAPHNDFHLYTVHINCQRNEYGMILLICFFFFDYFIRSSTRSFHFQFDASYYLLMWAAHTRTAIIVLLFYAEIAERCETCDDGLTFLMSNKFIGQTNNKYIYLRFEQWALTTVRHRW